MIKKQTKEQNTEAIFLQHYAPEKSSGMPLWRRWVILLSIVLTSTGVMVLLNSQPLNNQNIINTVFSAASVTSTIIQTIFTIWPNTRSSSTSSQTTLRRR